jgi:hypothetical protein
MLHAQYIITPGHESFDEGLTLFVNGVHHENWEGCKGILMSCSKSRDIFLPSPSVAGPRATSSRPYQLMFASVNLVLASPTLALVVSKTE